MLLDARDADAQRVVKSGVGTKDGISGVFGANDAGISERKCGLR